MSRAMNLTAPMDVVTATCAKHAIAISTIEPLDSGGTRVVLLNSEGAAELRRRMKKEIHDGPITRSGLYMARRPVPTSRT
jgi:protein-L-isoaspartate O-methyltransferase